MKKTRVLLFYGGQSGEHEISLISAAGVLTNLDIDRYEIIPIGIDKSGIFYLNQYEELIKYPTSLPVKTNSSILWNCISNGKIEFAADVAFPILHGPMYEDGCFQGLLNLGNIAYVGCDVLSSAIGMNKDIARKLAGIKTAKYIVLHEKKLHADFFTDWSWPLFVKPCSMGSSVGIHKVNNIEELKNKYEDARRYDDEVIIEEGLNNIYEIELAVLENSIECGAPRVSLPGEIIVNHPDGFYSYQAKYFDTDSPTVLCVPAKIDLVLQKKLQQVAADIFVALKCRGMARVDFFVCKNSNTIYFNEINTIPGFTSISMYPKLWQASGISYTNLLDELIDLALSYHKKRLQRVTDYS